MRLLREFLKQVFNYYILIFLLSVALTVDTFSTLFSSANARNYLPSPPHIKCAHK